MKSPIAVCLSGGIDSMAAAWLLKNRGLPIIGVHFLTGLGPAAAETVKGRPKQPETTAQATRIAADRFAGLSSRLGIPIKVIDCTKAFNSVVVDYFVSTYKAGQTPNPCMVCNPMIKFGFVFDQARKWGATRLATGHYARVLEGKEQRFHLLRGMDSKKDQSYFLARLTQAQLAKTVFPLGDFTKTRIVDMMGRIGLSPLTNEESQDICFIGRGGYVDFLASRLDTGEESRLRPGPIEDVRGNHLGTHKGLHRYTVGQRRGINCPGPEPYYVVRLEPRHNRLVVGRKADLLSRRCRVIDINWIQPPPSAPMRVRARVRYRHTAAAAELTPIDAQTALVSFDYPQSALTPGQGAVFYLHDEVLGGGWISRDK